MVKYREVLMHCSLFAGMDAEQMEAMLGCLGARVQSYAKGEAILAEGDPADRIGVILSGSAQVIREDYYGRRSIIARLEPADLFAESFACAGIREIPVAVSAIENVDALMIDAHRITHTCGKSCAFHHQMIYNMMRILARKNLVSSRKIEIISRRSTRDKLMAYLMQEAKNAGSDSFTIPYDRQELADYLEVERSGLSAEISKLRREGVLKSDRSKFTLLKTPEL